MGRGIKKREIEIRYFILTKAGMYVLIMISVICNTDRCRKSFSPKVITIYKNSRL